MLKGLKGFENEYACSRILLKKQILNPKQVTQISACNFHQDPGESKCGCVCNIWALGYPGISGVARLGYHPNELIRPRD